MGVVDDRGGRTRLDDPARIRHGEPIAGGLDRAQIVRHHEQTEPVFGLTLEQGAAGTRRP